MEVDDLTEYKQCLESWRFFVGLRFTVFAFFLTLTSALLYVVLTNSKFEDSLYRVLVSLVGLVCTFAVYIIEVRNQHLYDVCCNRAKVLEARSNQPDARKQAQPDSITLACAVQTATRRGSLFPRQFLTHSTGFFILYLVAALVWIGILCGAICTFKPAIFIFVIGSKGTAV